MSRSSTKIDEIHRKVRAMPRGGNLDALLNRECDELTRLLREEMVCEREQAASHEVGFPPSGLPTLPQRTDREPGNEEAPGRDPRR